MIKIFGVNFNTASDFGRNGDIVIKPLKAVIGKYENGDFYLDIEASTEYIDYFVEGRIIVADVPWLNISHYRSNEIFRIGNVSITHNKIVTRCLHITYDLNWFVPYFSISAHGMINVNSFINNLYDPHVGGGVGRHSFLAVDDNECMAYFDTNKTQYQHQSLLATINVLLNTNNLFFNRTRNGFGLSNERVETDTDIIFEYAKNIRTFQKSENWNDTVHEIATYIPTSMARQLYECPDAYAYYPAGYNKTNYIKYTKYIEFKSRLDPKDYQTASAYDIASTADIESQIDDYFKEHGKPKINYTLNAYVDSILDLGYKVKVRDRQMGVDVDASVIGFQYNLLTEMYDEVIFGNYKDSMKNYNYRINTNIKNLQDRVGAIAYPINSIFTTASNNQDPNNLSGFEGYWELLSSSSGIYTWKRLA